MVWRHKEGERLRTGLNIGNGYVVLHLRRFCIGYDSAVGFFARRARWRSKA